jgi:hypothetical protein
MKRIFLFSIFVFGVSGVCCAQSNKSESLTISTYYPAPYGVYKHIRLFPDNTITPGGVCVQEGEAVYSDSMHEFYVCQGISPNLKWQKIGSGMKSIVKNDVFPDQCSGSNSTAPVKDQLCSAPWFKDIVFDEPFTGKPDVIVFAQNISDISNSPCTEGVTDVVLVYPENINPTGFRLWASGSPKENTGTCGSMYEEYYSRAIVGWMAVGE